MKHHVARILRDIANRIEPKPHVTMHFHVHPIHPDVMSKIRSIQAAAVRRAKAF